MYIDFLSWRRWISENKSATWSPIVSQKLRRTSSFCRVLWFVVCLRKLYIIQTELSSFSRFHFFVSCIFTLYTIQSLILFVFFHSAIVFLLWQIFLKKTFFFVINFDLRNGSLEKCIFLLTVCIEVVFLSGVFKWEVHYLSY